MAELDLVLWKRLREMLCKTQHHLLVIYDIVGNCQTYIAVLLAAWMSNEMFRSCEPSSKCALRAMAICVLCNVMILLQRTYCKYKCIFMWLHSSSNCSQPMALWNPQFGECCEAGRSGRGEERGNKKVRTYLSIQT